MVKVCTTSCTTEDARPVQLESRLISFDSDGYRILGHCLHECLLIVSVNILEAGHRTLWHAHCTARRLARTFPTFVCIASLRADGVFLRKLEGIVHQTSVAA